MDESAHGRVGPYVWTGRPTEDSTVDESDHICGQVGPSAVDRSDHVVDESAHELLLGRIVDRSAHMYVDESAHEELLIKRRLKYVILKVRMKKIKQ